jgi:hypothetical protein
VARFASRLVRFRDGRVLSDARQIPVNAAVLAAESEPAPEAVEATA